MSDNSKIQWTDATLNVTTGCTKVSTGCANCYITRTTPFRIAGRTFVHPQDGKTARDIGASTGVLLHPDRITQPLHWRKPRRIFINSLADWLHDDVPDRLLVDLFAVIALTPRHTYQLVTKRPPRGRALLSSEWFPAAVEQALLTDPRFSLRGKPPHIPAGGLSWPLPNAWIGVSTENQELADQRIPILLDTPAAVRWISAEPLLGPVLLRNWVKQVPRAAGGWPTYLDWVVAGGESGPDARPMHPDWARQLRDQCTAAGVPFFFKQWGEWAPDGHWGVGPVRPRQMYVRPVLPRPARMHDGEGYSLSRVGNHRAGRELDGRTWDEYPAGAR